MPPKQVPQGTTNTPKVLQHFCSYYYRQCLAGETRQLKPSALDVSPNRDVLILWLEMELMLVTETEATYSSLGDCRAEHLLLASLKKKLGSLTDGPMNLIQFAGVGNSVITVL